MFRRSRWVFEPGRSFGVLGVFVALGLTLCLVWGATSRLLAQGAGRSASKFYPDSSDPADTLLRNAAGHARDRQWAEAIDMYQRIVQQYGDKVARLPKVDGENDAAGDFQLFVDLRQFCQRKLSTLPPEARAIYRGRVDPQAERWFNQGLKDRDREALRRVVEQAFASSWGDDAAEALGDLAFQDGRFEEALSNYRLVVPDRTGDTNVMIHPDPSVDLAKVAAKKLLCLAAIQAKGPTAEQLDAFGKQYPDAKGPLAGRDGSLLETLKAAIANDHLSLQQAPDGRWLTFAGSPARTRVVPGSIDVGSKQWRVDLDPVQATRTNRGSRAAAFAMNPIPAHRLLAYHPIVVGDQVIVTNGSRILAYNLNDRPESIQGAPLESVKPAWRHEPDRESLNPQATRNLAGPPRFTLTAQGDRIFARMGPNVIPSFNMGRRELVSPSRIVAVDRSKDGEAIWPSKSPSDILGPKRSGDAPSRSIGFEGTPVADERKIYVALTDRREETLNYVAALDAETGETRWVRYLGTAFSDTVNAFAFNGGMGGMGGAYSGDFGHRLLSLQGPTLYYQTNLGAVVALETETGAIRWVATYPRLDRSGSPSERDLNPAIVHEGLVIVAPDDSASILAFDAETGRLVWKSEPIDEDVKLAHLLGVAKGRLVATGDRVLLFDIKDGKLVSVWPDAGKTHEGFGRGLLAGDHIYWPTRNEIHVLDQGTGLRTEPSIKLQEAYQTGGGNLAVGDGYLIVAQADQLVVFCQNRRLIERYREEIAKNPEQAVGYFLMAQAAEATGQDDLALESLGRALTRARPTDLIDAAPLIDATRDHRFRLLLKMGRKAKLAKELAAAETRFVEAADAARLERDQLLAKLSLCEVQLERAAPEAAVKTLQGLLNDDRLRMLNTVAEEGRRSIRADLLINDRLGTILATHGRGLYDEFDRQARAMFEKAKAESDPRLLEDLTRRFPVAEVVPDTLLTLGKVELAAGRPREASRAFKRLLALGPPDGYRARALLGLAKSYEEQKLWIPSRDSYQQALSRYAAADVDSDEPGSLTKLGPLVEQRLGLPPFDKMVADRAEPSLITPLARLWTRKLDEFARPIPVEGTPPSQEASRVFLASANELRSMDLRSGESSWSADLAGPPIWAGYLDDRLIAATETRIVALGLKDGSVLWTYDSGTPPALRGGDNPFEKTVPQKRRADLGEPIGRLHAFQNVNGRIFCMKGDRELLAIDGDRGLVDWSFASPGGEVNPRLLVGPHKIVLQLRKPDSILILETANGRKLAEYLTTTDEEWPRAPFPIDDDHVALVTDRLTVALFDLNKGVNSWRVQPSLKMPTNGAPRFFGDAERLFMIHDGNELIRLDAMTGNKKWSKPLGFEDLGDHPEALALDGERIYWINGNVLNAASLADGSIVWSHYLSGPENGWSIELTDRYVMAYPGLLRKSDNEMERLPVVFRKRDTGELVQRLLFPTPAREVAVRLMPGGALVATPTAVWALGGWKPVDGLKGER